MNVFTKFSSWRCEPFFVASNRHKGIARFGLCAIVLGSFLFGLLLSPGCSERQKKPTVPSGEHDDHGEHVHKSESTAKSPATLILATKPAEPKAGELVQINAMLHDESGKMIKDFERVHEKLAHLIIVREGLDEFAHLHPSIDPNGNLTVEHPFAKGGKYHAFIDYKPTGMSQSTSNATLNVTGDLSAAPPLEPNVPGLLDGDGLRAQVSIQATNQAAVVRFQVLDSNGQPVTDLQPYLGAMGHLVVISAAADQYVHAHPLDSKSASSVVEFEVHFPKPGLYKGWGQFQRADQVFTIPAVFNIEIVAEHH